MSSLATSAPKRSQELGVRTKTLRLQIRSDETGLSLYTDASFTPDSDFFWMGGADVRIPIEMAEQQTGHGVDFNGGVEGGIALLGLAALLKDVMEKVIHVDSTSALAISEGSGSWRTRHLRVKAEWLSERLHSGAFSIRHCAGRVQLADLLTKVMTWARVRELLLCGGGSRSRWHGAGRNQQASSPQQQQQQPQA